MKAVGRVSKFGGPDDDGMRFTEGVSFYEHHEADKRPDLFLPRGTDPTQGVGRRLRYLQAHYIALNVPLTVERHIVHKSLWKITNLRTGQFVLSQLVDRGPSAAGRLVDVADITLTALRLLTDQEVEAEEVTNYGITFGLYEKAAS